MNRIQLDHNLVSEKIGYDYANKKMMIKVYDSLRYIVEHSISKPTWKNVINHMFVMFGDDINRINVNGYYSTIRKNLKDIGVIKTNGRKGLSKGPNWDRFYSDEDWSWFITNTNSGGYGTIVK